MSKSPKEELINLEHLGLKHANFTRVGKADKARGYTAGDANVADFLRYLDKNLPFKYQVSAGGGAHIGHSDGRGGEHKSTGIIDIGNAGYSPAQIQMFHKVAMAYPGGVGRFLREGAGTSNDHNHLGNFGSTNAYAAQGNTLPNNNLPPLQIRTPKPIGPTYDVAHLASPFGPPVKPTLSKTQTPQPNYVLPQNAPLPAPTPNPLYQYGQNLSEFQNRPEPTNFGSDYLKSAGNALSGYTHDQDALNQGGGLGSALGDLTGQLGYMGAGALIGGAAGSEVPVVGNIVGGVAGGALAAGGTGALRELQNQRVSGQATDYGKVLTHGAINAAGALPIGAGLGSTVLQKILYSAGTNAAIGGGLDLASQAAEQGTMTPNLNLTRSAQSAAMGGALGGFAGLLHTGLPHEAPRPHEQILSAADDHTPYGLAPHTDPAARTPIPQDPRAQTTRELIGHPDGTTEINTALPLPDNAGQIIRGEGTTTFPETFKTAPDVIPREGAIDLYPVGERPAIAEGARLINAETTPQEPIEIKVPARKAQRRATEIAQTEFYAPEEVAVTKRAAEGTVRIEPTPYEPTIQTQIDSLRGEYKNKLITSGPGQDRAELYKQFLSERQDIIGPKQPLNAEPTVLPPSEKPIALRDLAQEFDLGKSHRGSTQLDERQLQELTRGFSNHAGLDVIKRSLRASEVTGEVYVGNRTSSPEKVTFTPVGFIKNKNNEVMVASVNNQGHYAAYKLNEFQGPLTNTGKPGYTSYDFNKVSRAEGIHTDTYRAEKSNVNKLVEAHPEDKTLRRISELYRKVKTVDDVHAIRKEVEKLQSQGKLKKYMQELEDQGIGKCK